MADLSAKAGVDIVCGSLLVIGIWGSSFLVFLSFCVFSDVLVFGARLCFFVFSWMFSTLSV